MSKPRLIQPLMPGLPTCRVSTTVEEVIAGNLDALAERNGTTVADLIRVAIWQYVMANCDIWTGEPRNILPPPRLSVVNANDGLPTMPPPEARARRID